jgi:hypothetical protein
VTALRRPAAERGARIAAWRRALLPLGLVVAAGLGALDAAHRRTSILLGAASLIGALLLADPLILPVLALPGALLLQRLGGSAAGSSVDLSDALLFTAAFLALPLVAWRRAVGLRRALRWAFLYTGLMLPSVLLHHNSHAVLEFAHRILLVEGALVVGWLVGSSHRARQAFTLYLLGASVLALIALGAVVSSHFHAAQFGLYQKNFIGAAMYIAIVVAHLNPSWIGVDKRLARAAKYLCLLALLASQSKQAVIALVAAFAIAFARDRQLRRRSQALVVAVAPVVTFAVVVALQEVLRFHHHFNSVKVRSIALSAALGVWHLDPWFGQGPRWYYLPQFSSYFQPPNIVVEELTATGIVGLIGLVVMLSGLVWVLLRLPRPIGTVAVAILVARVVESLFDLYWVSAIGMLPFLIAGIALGAADQARASAGAAGANLLGRTATAAGAPGSDRHRCQVPAGVRRSPSGPAACDGP